MGVHVRSDMGMHARLDMGVHVGTGASSAGCPPVMQASPGRIFRKHLGTLATSLYFAPSKSISRGKAGEVAWGAAWGQWGTGARGCPGRYHSMAGLWWW